MWCSVGANSHVVSCNGTLTFAVVGFAIITLIGFAVQLQLVEMAFGLHHMNFIPPWLWLKGGRVGVLSRLNCTHPPTICNSTTTSSPTYWADSSQLLAGFAKVPNPAVCDDLFRPTTACRRKMLCVNHFRHSHKKKEAEGSLGRAMRKALKLLQYVWSLFLASMTKVPHFFSLPVLSPSPSLLLLLLLLLLIISPSTLNLAFSQSVTRRLHSSSHILSLYLPSLLSPSLLPSFLILSPPFWRLFSYTSPTCFYPFLRSSLLLCLLLVGWLDVRRFFLYSIAMDNPKRICAVLCCRLQRCRLRLGCASSLLLPFSFCRRWCLGRASPLAVAAGESPDDAPYFAGFTLFHQDPDLFQLLRLCKSWAR